jgi:hypothetical protein
MHMSQLRSTARDERGLSMFVVIVVMLATSMSVAAAFAAANGDLPMSGMSKDRKASYAAAEAGLNFYSFHLNQDSDYWTKCDAVPAPNATELNPVNQQWDGKTPSLDPRRWRTVPGSTAQYTIELLPAPGYSKCIVGDQKSIVDMATGTFRMRFTGRPSPTSKLRRSIVTTFRRSGFLDFLYFTDFEDKDPQAYDTLTARNNAQAACADRYRAARTSSACDEIQFVTNDRVNGPFHTNDDILVCGTPVFGRTATDKIEISGAEPGWKKASSSCSGGPSFVGTRKAGVKKLVLPTTNNDLKTAALTNGIVYTGTTHIRLNSNSTMDVSAWNATTKKWVTTPAVGMPANGVVYVQGGAGGCTVPNPPPTANYDTEPKSCGTLYLSGTYSDSLTFGADQDIVIGSQLDTAHRDLRRNTSSDGVVGLIANNFVRIYHKVNRSSGCVNSDSKSDVYVDAAILSLRHSFIVDNYGCGDDYGKLHVMGAIAQKYRGPVGTGSGGTILTGFLKDYNYDDRLRFRSPPYFLPPVDAAWTVLRRNEQVPAR